MGGAPDLGHGVESERGVRLGEMATAGGERSVQFRLADQVVADERAAHGFDGGGQVVGHRITRADAYEKRTVLNVSEAGVSCEMVQASPKPDVGVRADEGLLEELRETVPRGMARIALERADVRLFERHDSAGRASAVISARSISGMPTVEATKRACTRSKLPRGSPVR